MTWHTNMTGGPTDRPTPPVESPAPSNLEVGVVADIQYLWRTHSPEVFRVLAGKRLREYREALLEAELGKSEL